VSDRTSLRLIEMTGKRALMTYFDGYFASTYGLLGAGALAAAASVRRRCK